MSTKKTMRKIIAVVLCAAILIGILPQTNVMAATKSATLSNLGNLGTVSIGDKTESGIWYQTQIAEKPTFCLDLGKACHSGDVYVSSTDSYSSDSSNTKKALEAKIGYWYYTTKKQSIKAWVYAQCLIWSVEEGYTSKSELTDVIKQVRSNTGYYNSKTAAELYKQIFDIEDTVKCEITKWTYSGSGASRQVLLEVKSGNLPEVEYTPQKTNQETWYRQRIVLIKKDDLGNHLANIRFKITALNYKQMYSYDIGGKERLSGDQTEAFETTAVTDEHGYLSLRFTYRLQSKDYYYIEDEELESMSKADKEAVREAWDEMGYKYPNSLKYMDALELQQQDIDNQKENLDWNQYIIEELGSDNKNLITSNPDFSITDSDYVEAYYEKLSATKIRVNLKGGWWRSAGEEWQDGDYTWFPEGNNDLTVTNNTKKAKVKLVKKDKDTGLSVPQGDASLDGAVYDVWSSSSSGSFFDENGTDLGKRQSYVVKNGIIETDYLTCGVTYYYQEQTPPEGYKLDTEIHSFTVDGSNYDKEFNICDEPVGESLEEVKKGRISIIKVMSGNLSGIIPPETGS